MDLTLENGKAKTILVPTASSSASSVPPMKLPPPSFPWETKTHAQLGEKRAEGEEWVPTSPELGTLKKNRANMGNVSDRRKTANVNNRRGSNTGKAGQGKEKSGSWYQGRKKK